MVLCVQDVILLTFEVLDFVHRFLCVHHFAFLAELFRRIRKFVDFLHHVLKFCVLGSISANRRILVRLLGKIDATIAMLYPISIEIFDHVAQEALETVAHATLRRFRLTLEFFLKNIVVDFLTMA